MRPVLLHLDDALVSQRALAAFCGAKRGVEIDALLLGPQLRLWSRDDAIAALDGLLDTQLPPGREPLLCHIGSGDFHHVAALLTARARPLGPPAHHRPRR